VLDRSVGGLVQPVNIKLVTETFAETGKPSFVVSTYHGSGADPAAIAATRAGTPVLDGLSAFIAAARVAFAWRDYKLRPPMQIEPPDPDTAARWRARLTSGKAFDEIEGQALLSDFGVPTVPSAVAEDETAALVAASRIGYPVALKIAMPGIAHKSDVSGVALGIDTPESLIAAYRDMADRLGPRVAVTKMIDGPTIEMILGVTRDPMLGPVVLLGFGGIHAEVLNDVVFLKPPFDAAEARRKLDQLRLRQLLDGVRGAPPGDIESLADAAARFSILAASLGDVVESIDVNPLLVLPDGCVAVDALVVPRS
jgi:acyl-CoA synthetase (NDP forming)